MSFPLPLQWVVKRPRLRIIPYAISGALAVGTELAYPDSKWMSPIFITAIGFIVAAGVFVVGSSLSAFRSSDSPLARQRAKVILLGSGLAFPLPLGAFLVQNLFGSFFGLNVQANTVAILQLFFPASIGYAVARYNLFDVDRHIKRALGYTLMTIAVAGTYLVTQLAVEVALRPFFPQGSDSFTALIFAILVVFLFQPAFERLKKAVERLFLRSRIDQERVVGAVRSALDSVFIKNEIIHRLISVVLEELSVESASVLVAHGADGTSGHAVVLDAADPAENKEQLIREIELQPGNPLLELMHRGVLMISRYDLEENAAYASVRAAALAAMDELNAVLLVPLIYQNRTTGALAVGAKRSRMLLRHEEVQVLISAAREGGAAMENARLADQVRLNVTKTQAMEGELQSASEIQRALVPPPLVRKGRLVIHSEYRPAERTGGDWWGFLESKGKLALFIADATGHGLPGTLLTASARSCFSVLNKLAPAPDFHLTPNTLMSFANRVIHDAGLGKVVMTFFVAVVDLQDETLTYGVAAHDAPLLIQKREGQFRSDPLVMNSGLALGEQAELPQIQERTVPFKPGDSLLMYTDGLIEVLGRTRYFGTRQLFKLAEKQLANGPAHVLGEVVGRVNKAIDEQPLQDDVTVVLVHYTEEETVAATG